MIEDVLNRLENEANAEHEFSECAHKKAKENHCLSCDILALIKLVRKQNDSKDHSE